jgi:uncharacterized protein involved in exopolysaccharide biosynthesis
MNDSDKHFDRSDQKLDLICSGSNSASTRHASHRDEIEFSEIWNILWCAKWRVLGVTLLFAISGMVYALSLPNIYRSEGVYAPAQNQSSKPIGGHLGGIAAMAGITMGANSSNDIDQAMALLTSWPFLEGVVQKNNLKPLIMGVTAWHQDGDMLIWDDGIYDPISMKWVREPSGGKLAEPSSYEVYAKFVKMIGVSFDAKTSMLKISVDYYSPKIAKEWVDLLVVHLNEAFRARDIADAKKNMDYLERKIQETSIAEMQAVLYGMIETQMKTLMLAEVDNEYLIKQVIPAYQPEIKVAPKRVLIVLFSVIFAGLISVFFALVFGLLKRQ